MDKLEYDSLHKFQVSLGLIFIALPFVLLLYLFNGDIALISQSEFEALSAYSQNRLHQHDLLINIFLIIFPLLCLALFILGGRLLYIGIKNWKKVQSDIDGVIAADRLKHELDAEQMKQSEVLKRTIEEVKESSPNETVPEQSAIMRHMDIEELFFSNAIPTHIKRRYFFKRNLKIGRFEYDGIAISKKDNIDLLYEIKYWRQPRTTQMLRHSLEHLYSAGVNYETVKQRNFKCILAIVTSKETIETMQRWVERLSQEETAYDFSKFEIQYVAEEDLHYQA